MSRASITKFFMVAVLFFAIISPGKAVAVDADADMGGLFFDLSNRYHLCKEYLKENPQGICDSISKVSNPWMNIDNSAFVSGNMRVGSGEIIAKPPESADVSITISIDYEGGLYMHSETYGKVKVSRETAWPSVKEFLKREVERNLRDAFTACQTHIADYPYSSCDSFELLEKNGFRLADTVEFIIADMDSSSGSIGLQEAMTKELYVIDHRGNISE